MAMTDPSNADPALAVGASGVVLSPDVDLGYETFGQGGAATPLVVVNGGPGLSHAYMMMNDLWARVGRARLVVLYDQRGTGASKRLRPGAPQDLEAQVADLETLRTGLGLDKVALLGDSYGGMLAMAYAARHPQHVSALVLSNAGPPSWKDLIHLFPEVFPDIKMDIEAKLAEVGPSTAAGKRLKMHDHFRMLFHSPVKRDAFMARMGDLGHEPAIQDAVMAEIADIDLNPMLGGFAFPTLILIGRYDMNVAPLTSWRTAQQIPGAKVVFFEQSGHLPSFEEPELYFAELDAFLKAKDATRREAADGADAS